MKIWPLVLIVAIILASGCTKQDKVSSHSTADETNKFIVANPIELSQIERISKFRSCVGHDYSGLNIYGEKEALRSMKHYVEPKQQVISSSKIKVFAPFDGIIANIDQDFASFEGTQRGVQVWLSGASTNDWNFVFFHVDLLQSLKLKSKLKAGELIGYADISNSPNFDITLKKFSIRDQFLDSPFSHMSDSVLEEYKSRGVTPDKVIIPKDVRDASPCPVEGTGEGGAKFSGYRDEDFVALRY